MKISIFCRSVSCVIRLRMQNRAFPAVARAQRSVFSMFAKRDVARRRRHNRMKKMSIRGRNAILEEFIGIYKSEPCLWRVKSKDYHDRNKRAAAYDKLIEKLKEVEPTSTKEDVVKKINTFRSNVRRERKKCEESMKPAACFDDIYKPTLWYYDLFDFVGDQDTSQSSQLNIYDDRNDSNDRLVENMIEYPMENSIDKTINNPAESCTIQKQETTRKKDQVQVTGPVKKENEKEELTNEVFVSLRDNFKRPTSAPEDQYDLLGRAIAIKLRSLEKRQRLIAEKMINDTLFEVEMGNLNTESYQNSSPTILRNTLQHQTGYPRNSTFIPSPSPSFTSRTPSPSP